jgi:hypothetical protein
MAELEAFYGWWYVKADLGVKARVPERQQREKHSF